jgi:hypothetical protein
VSAKNLTKLLVHDNTIIKNWLKFWTIQQIKMLGVNDLVKVLDELCEVRAMWYDIGLRLNVLPETLEDIMIKGLNDNTSLRQVLTVWLRSGKATWSDLCQALRHETIGKGKLADSLLSKHHTGRHLIKLI